MTYSPIRAIFLPFLLATLVLNPAVSFAKENENKGQDKKEIKIEKVEKTEKNEKKEKNEKTSCLRAFGHLIAPGWIKIKGEIDNDEIQGRCFFPFGISKKFKSGTTTPPVVDTTSPVITNVESRTETTSAVVNWTTNERADSAIFFSRSSPVNTQSSTTPLIERKDRTSNHQIAIKGLSASATYYAVVRSRDAAGNVAYSPEFSFVTKTPVLTGDTVPPTIHTVVVVMSSSTASVGWMTNEPATSKMFYGLTTPVNINSTTTNFVESTALTLNHMLNVSGLATSTRYYFVIQSKDAAGNTQNSAEFSAITGI